MTADDEFTRKFENIGELHTTFAFDNPAEAKVMWERVQRRCRYIGVFRWREEGRTETGGTLITILTEDTADQRPQYEKARTMLRRGREIETPPDAAMRLRARRRERMVATGASRTVIRHPLGAVIDKDGFAHPYKRPQG